MNILVIGDVVGRPGRRAIEDRLPVAKRELGIDLCVVNGENAAGGSGITPEFADRFYKAGADVITTGDHIWKRKEIYPYLEGAHPVLRPANFPSEARGKGMLINETANGISYAVVNLIGRVFMPPVDCPFQAVDRVLEEIGNKTHIVVVDMHAEATSEKIAMGWHLDGKASVVFGTHTHIATADERVLPQGTGYITDVGMTGPYASVIGRKVTPVLKKFITQMPAPFDVAKKDVRLCGAVFEVDHVTGRCSKAERVRIDLDA